MGTSTTNTLTRRELLSKSTVLLLMVPVAGAALGCSSSNDASPSPSTNDGGTGACQGIFETSTVTSSHTHTLCVPETDLTSPPSAGAVYTTSFDASHTHTHTVTLSQAQLQSVAGGATITVTTSSPLPHNFTIAKA